MLTYLDIESYLVGVWLELKLSCRSKVELTPQYTIILLQANVNCNFSFILKI
jgi:hypothetical protein